MDERNVDEGFESKFNENVKEIGYFRVE